MFTLRDMQLSDIKECRTIVSDHWGIDVAESAACEMFEMFTSNSHWPPHYYVVEDLGGVVGFGGFKAAWLMSNTYELIWVNVAPRAIGMGVGTMLTEKRIQTIRNLGGTLITLMTKNCSFFEKFGFRGVADFDGYHLMVAQLAPVIIAPDRCLNV